MSCRTRNFGGASFCNLLVLLLIILQFTKKDHGNLGSVEGGCFHTNNQTIDNSTLFVIALYLLICGCGCGSTNLLCGR
ncbi:hypothetical protein Q428_05010 [Fervidicella metallireducens AeB]|uniref:Uncharacterized protein n=1 Tax=Fervidicella metallireducens AeB TaxID=1403537 RepID=A0A017RWF7_9CLOT|nr:hypothetical protein [Fervidicella metallireducens]EYE89002.1 hypothetical protein Q428_05010 [Fervidicella metallireducens AeB]